LLLPLGILASAGGAALADYELISTTILSSSAASVTFSGLGTSAAAYKHLQIRYVGAQSANEFIHIQYNGSNTGYTSHHLEANGSSVSSINSIAGNWTGVLGSLGYGVAGVVNSLICDILDPFSTVKNKTSRTLRGSAASGLNNLCLASSIWGSTAAVTSITMGFPTAQTFLTGSRFSLYGLK
jgi:hypothetical protein